MATQAELDEAKAALHALNTGTLEQVVRSGTGREVRYTAVNRRDLEAYISSLEAELAQTRRGPIYMGMPD